MPTTFIQDFDAFDDSAFIIIDLGLDVEVDLEVTKPLKTTVDLGLDIETHLQFDHELGAEVDLGLDVETHLFINNEANIFLDTEIDLGIDVETDLHMTREWLAVVDLGIDVETTLEVRSPERFYWNVLVNTGANVSPGRYRTFRARLTVDGVQKDIISCECTESRRDSYLSTLNVRLAKKEDFDAVSRDSIIKFEILEFVGGVWKETVLIDTGQTSSKGYSITRNLDTFSISAVAGYNARLMKAPINDLVIYDSAEITLNADDFEPISDTNGNSHETERKSFYQMKLSQLLNEVFITRAGFSGIISNITDYRISRVDFRAGRPFIESVKGILGPYSPSITPDESGNLIIRDTSYLYNEGDPAPTQITLASDLINVNLDRQYDRIDGFRLSYSVTRREYDYTAARQVSQTTPYGTFGSGNFQKVTVTKNYIDYFRNSDPFTPVDTELTSISTETVMNGQTIFESEEIFTYDLFGNPTARTKTYSKRLPDVQNGGALSLLTLKTENENWQYKPHPFVHGANYLAKHEVYERGKQITDSTNQQLGEDWKRDYENAYRGGNLADGLTVLDNAPLRTLIEQFRPLRGGKAEVSVYEVDHAGNSPVAIRDETQTVPGEIATNGRIKQQLETFVLEDGDEITEDSILEDLNAGEIPLGQARALALRLLKKRKASPQMKRAEVAGFDPRLVKGFICNLIGRNGENLGIYSIEGVTVRGDRNGFFTTIDAVELTSSGVMPIITEHENGTLYPELNTPMIVRRRIPCQTGYFLSCEPVANLMVEARKLGASSWIDIETTPIDLSADNGNVIVFEFRFTGTALGTAVAKINVGR